MDQGLEPNHSRQQLHQSVYTAKASAAALQQQLLETSHVYMVVELCLTRGISKQQQ